MLKKYVSPLVEMVQINATDVLADSAFISVNDWQTSPFDSPFK